MRKYQLSIQIEEPFADLVDEDWLRRAVEVTLATTGMSSAVELGLVIASDDTVHQLNRSYRAVDNTTDVLAFALSQLHSDDAEPFITPPDDIIHLGEVIISYPQAEHQADEQHHSLEQELKLLVAHGVLHLLGYDHEHPEAEQRMRAMEAKVMEAVKGRR